MDNFSQRRAITKKKSIQVNDIDDDLRVGILNALHPDILRRALRIQLLESERKERERGKILRASWEEFFKKPISSMPGKEGIAAHIQEFVLNEEWYKVYDLLEYLLPRLRKIGKNCQKTIVAEINRVHERENSAYRIVGNLVAETTNEAEIQEVGVAVQSPNEFVANQIKSALAKLADRRNPDYRNSMKESINAVESVATQIADSKNGALGGALSNIQSRLNLHSSLVESFKKLYGYLSDEKAGVRHGQKGKDNLTFDDAWYVLVTCSAFANYLLRLAERAGIELSNEAT